jgi:antitoxin HicB
MRRESTYMRYHFRVHKEGTGYWAECVELDGCVTRGKNKFELEAKMSEALDLFLSEPQDSKLILPEPSSKVRGRNIVDVRVSPRVALAHKLRRERLVRGLSQSAFAKLIGMGGLYSYQKLEQATTNPRFETLERIKKVCPDFGLDELFG